MAKTVRRGLAAGVIGVLSVGVLQSAAQAYDIYWLSNPTQTSFTAQQTSDVNPSIGVPYPTTNLPSCLYASDCATTTILPNQPIGSSNYGTQVVLSDTLWSGGTSYSATLTPVGGSGSVTFSANDPQSPAPAYIKCSSNSSEASCSTYDLTAVLATPQSMDSPVMTAATSNLARVRDTKRLIVPVEVYAKSRKHVPVKIIVKRQGEVIAKREFIAGTNRPLQVPIRTADRVTKRLSGSQSVRLAVRLSHQMKSGRWVTGPHRFSAVQETQELKKSFRDMGPVGVD